MADEGGIDPARRAKVRRLAEVGFGPYGGRFDRTATARDIREAYEGYAARTVRVAGRVRALRGHGRMTFADLEDPSGTVQVQFTADALGERYADLDLLDLGDILGVEGTVFRTRTGEPTVRAQTVDLLTKSLRPLPSKFHGLRDTDLRYRQRYLDLIANPEVRQVFRMRSRILAETRRFLDARGFLEVETPLLVPLAGGATARPFRTHHHALDLDLSLRIAIELHLKRLMVGGLERVYEIGRVFRNEGISTRHNPEFTLLELYQAYGDLRDIMALTESLVAHLAEVVTGSVRVPYEDQVIDFSPPWPRVSMLERLRETLGIDWLSVGDDVEARALARAHGVPTDPNASRGHVLERLVARYVEPSLIQPTFLVDHPLEISPLAKERPDFPGVADRFEAYAMRNEMANAFSELNDALEQRRRFEFQVEERRRTSDEEIPDPDEDFLTALEYGMPPAGGLGIGMDRLVMLLTNRSSLREVILFPLTRPLEPEDDAEEDAVFEPGLLREESAAAESGRPQVDRTEADAPTGTPSGTRR